MPSVALLMNVLPQRGWVLALGIARRPRKCAVTWRWANPIHLPLRSPALTKRGRTAHAPTVLRLAQSQSCEGRGAECMDRAKAQTLALLWYLTNGLLASDGERPSERKLNLPGDSQKGCPT